MSNYNFQTTFESYTLTGEVDFKNDEKLEFFIFTLQDTDTKVVIPITSPFFLPVIEAFKLSRSADEVVLKAWNDYSEQDSYLSSYDQPDELQENSDFAQDDLPERDNDQ